ncbi:hypothetical protein ACQ4PT_028540 [Festuca glaucescens]
MSLDVAGAEKQKKVLLAEGLLLPASMVLVQAFTMGALLLSKLAFNVGMAPFVLLAYRNLIGSMTVAPFAFYFEREMMKKVNMKIFGWISMTALFGIVLAMGLHYYGLRATNAGYSVDFLNLIPVVTFVTAVILRVKTLVRKLGQSGEAEDRDMSGQDEGPRHRDLRGRDDGDQHVRVSKEFPSKYFSTMLACVSGTVQAAVFGLVLDRDLSAWALKWDLQLLVVVYSGVFNTGVSFCLISWAIARRGPTYPSMFNSLSLVVTTVLDSVLLGTDVSVGSLLGAMLIILGLYAFLWGKGKEAQEQRKQIRAAANGDQNGCPPAAAVNGVDDSLQVGKHEVRIRVEVS